MDDPEKISGTSSILCEALCIISNPSVNSNLSYSPETLSLGRKWWYFVSCDLKIQWMTLENNRAPLLYNIKLCVLHQSHGWIKTGVTVRKCSIQVKIVNFLSHVTLKFDRWPWKTICCFKFCASFHSHGGIQTWVTVRKRSIWVKISNFFVLCDLEIWQMTLKNNRAPLLWCFKLCASFHSHWWIQTGVTVRKHQIWVKINKFFSRVTLKFDGWPWKTIRHLF